MRVLFSLDLMLVVVAQLHLATHNFQLVLVRAIKDKSCIINCVELDQC